MAEGKYQPSILVRSEDRTPSSTGSHDFQVATRKPLKGRYLVSYLQIPASAYSVSTTNNVVYFNEPAGGGALTATLTPGNYSISSLASEIAARMTAASGGYNTYACTGTTLTGKLTTSAVNNWYFQWSLTTSSAAAVLGYPATNTTPAASSTSPNLVDLGYPAALNVGVREAASGYDTTASFSGDIWVPFNASFGTFATLEAERLPQILDFRSPSSVLTIRVQDDAGTAVNLNGANWRMMLRHYGDYPETVEYPSR